jgi:hypothetical protein
MYFVRVLTFGLPVKDMVPYAKALRASSLVHDRVYSVFLFGHHAKIIGKEKG